MANADTLEEVRPCSWIWSLENRFLNRRACHF